MIARTIFAVTENVVPLPPAASIAKTFDSAGTLLTFEREPTKRHRLVGCMTGRLPSSI
jgi:hypothetical protein